MSERQELNEFLINFRLTLKKLALYPEQHPAQQAFPLELKEKLDPLLFPNKTLWLGVTTRALRLQDDTWLTEKIHEEIARYLHSRGIKSLRIKPGLTVEELTLFLKFLSKSPRKDFYREKESFRLLEEQLPHIEIEWLDYSLVLAAQGEEIKEVWSYLFEKALRSRQVRDLNQAASFLVKALEHFSVCELAANDREWPFWSHFFSLLRENDTRSFKIALSAIVKNLLCQPNQLTLPSLEEKFQSLLEGFDEENLASCLVNIFREDASFDASKLCLWFRLTRKKKHGLMASFLERNLETKLAQWPVSFIRNKFTQLIQGYSVEPYPEAYYQAFLALLKRLPAESKIQLDRSYLWKHEVALHLLLLRQGKKAEALFDSFNFLTRHLSRMMESQDFILLREMHRVLVDRQPLLSGHDEYLPTLKRLTAFIEKKILREENFAEQKYFVDNLNKSALGLNYYLQSIFGDGHVSPAILKLFFRFFLDHLFYFYINLDEKAGDKSFLEKMIASLAEVDCPASFVTLKNIFNFGDSELRRKVLSAMQRLSTFEESFLWPHLLERPLSWQKEALLWLKKKPASLERALRLLLSQSSPFGLKNNQLIEAAKLVGEIGLDEALPYLKLLARRPFFWNRRLRKEVKKILEFFNER